MAIYLLLRSLNFKKRFISKRLLFKSQECLDIFVKERSIEGWNPLPFKGSALTPAIEATSTCRWYILRKESRDSKLLSFWRGASTLRKKKKNGHARSALVRQYYSYKKRKKIWITYRMSSCSHGYRCRVDTGARIHVTPKSFATTSLPHVVEEPRSDILTVIHHSRVK